MFAGSQNVLVTGGTFSQVQSPVTPAFDHLRQETIPTAFHNSSARSHSSNRLPNPYRHVIETSMSWVRNHECLDSDASVMWLDGDAGIGKTVLAYALSDACEEENLLAASFFFCRSDRTRSSGNKFISTIAYQICINIPSSRSYIEAAIANNPLIFEQSVRLQLKNLIILPLKKVREDNPGSHISVVIIDALDECHDIAFQMTFIQALIKTADTLPIRFLLTSRPEPHISSTFDFLESPSPGTTHLSLDDTLDPKSPNISILSPVPDLSFGNWIWTWEHPYSEPPIGPRPLRKTVLIPDGRLVDSLIIDITCDDIFALYVNGKVVGSGTHWRTVHRWSVTFPRTSKLVIAVYATNDPIGRAWAGFIASGITWDSVNFNGEISYAIKTDNIWKCSNSVPPVGFERLSFDDSDWTLARSEGRYGAEPWGYNVSRPTNIESVGDGFTGIMGVSDAPQAPRATQRLSVDGNNNGGNASAAQNTFIPDLGNAEWIWTQEQPYHNPPPGPRRFRKTFLLPDGKFADSLIIDITCDDFHTLYVNSKVLGYGLQWNVARRWSITFPRTNKLVIAVYASNDPVHQSFAGVLASAVAWDSTDLRGGCHAIKTDSSWKYGGTSSWDGLDRPIFGEDDWNAVRVQGPYGADPWGCIPKPITVSPITEGFKGINDLPDPPRAPLAAGGIGTIRTIFV